jgi:type II secretory ATPase GspE/PulE/Tfp pilus assembly ATPase PilB-like protein
MAQSSRQNGAPVPDRLFTRVFDLDDDKKGPASVRPVVRLVNLIIEEGLRSKAEQISLKGESEGVGVHYLITGEWRRVMVIPAAAGGPMANRLKVMANLDISRRPTQHGVIHVRLDGRDSQFDIETTISSSGAEDVLLRLR